MISVMNEFEIDRNPNSAPDLSFLGMESPKDEAEMDPIEPEIPPSLDLEGSRVRVSDPNEEAPFEMNGLVIGDMVWGKVKSHPWWPGHLYNEAFASPSVRSAKRDGLVLVAFFGDNSYGWFNPAELIPYEPNFLEKSKQTLLRSFVNAVEESIDEAGRRAALCLSCRCENPYNFRPTRVPNYFKVDVVGYERNAVYSRRQIDKERSSFVPKDAVGFLRELALMPRGDKVKDVEWHRKLAVWLAVRRHRFEEFDETYAQAFGQQPVRPVRNEMGVLEQSESFAPRGAPLSGPLVVADALDKSKSDSASSSKHKDKKKKKKEEEEEDESLKKKKKRKEEDEYVLKRRRDERSLSSLPDAYFPENKLQRSTPSDYVHQKRESAVTESRPAPPPMPMPALETSAGEKQHPPML
ncbi:uncharacterized protein A4U43_C08F31380 [Asparagus officinalis]|nr:uncharacterized protein A4U43_C08F31380 [Asparagus officinalis]